MKKWKRNDFVSFKRQIFISSINNYQINYQLVTSCLRIARSYKVATVGVNNKPVQNTWYRLIQPRSVSTWPILYHSCPILSNRFHPTKQHSICCRSENCISLARTRQSAVDSIDSFDLSNGKVYYRFDKCGRRSDNCISLVTTATWCKIVESIDSFDWWEWLFHSQFQIKSLSNRRIHLNDD